MSELLQIQQMLKVPKNQYNGFGKYKYRSCEDILEALKEPLKANGCYVTLSDTVELIGDRYYIKATATLKKDGKELESTTAYARESLTKKGMDDSQISGGASSYSRKYALNGLFLCDDTKDTDTNEHYQEVENTPNDQPVQNGYDEILSICTDKQPDGSVFWNETAVAMFKFYDIEHLELLPKEKYPEALVKAKKHAAILKSK